MPVYIVNGVLVAAPSLGRAAAAYEELKKEPAISADKVCDEDEVITSGLPGSNPEVITWTRGRKHPVGTTLVEARHAEKKTRAKRTRRGVGNKPERVLGATFVMKGVSAETPDEPLTDVGVSFDSKVKR